MNNSPDQKREKTDEGVIPKAKQIAAAAQETLQEAPDRAREQVQRFPLAAVGIAFGAGIALGALGWALLAPRPPTLSERVGGLTDKKRLRKLLARFR